MSNNSPRSTPALRSRSTAAVWLVLALAALTGSATTIEAQVVPPYRRYQPLNQSTPPGTAARWADLMGRASPTWTQPIRIIVDGEAEVTIYNSRPLRPLTAPSPLQLGVMVGHSYRLRISQMPQLPGAEIYPTIEVIDRLHPPAGQKHNFPIPVYIDRSDIVLAMNGNLVTRVVYLEQPQIAAPFELDEATRARDVDPSANALSEADRYGRPMLILRLGGRLPNPLGEPPAFFGTGGPISESRPGPRPQPAANPNSQPTAVEPNSVPANPALPSEGSAQ